MKETLSVRKEQLSVMALPSHLIPLSLSGIVFDDKVRSCASHNIGSGAMTTFLWNYLPCSNHSDRPLRSPGFQHLSACVVILLLSIEISKIALTVGLRRRHSLTHGHQERSDWIAKKSKAELSSIYETWICYESITPGKRKVIRSKIRHMPQ